MPAAEPLLQLGRLVVRVQVTGLPASLCGDDAGAA
jgi:hypothetical protein